MADISMCDDTNCPSRGQCHRYCAWPSKWQSHGSFRRDGDKCDYFWEAMKHDRSLAQADANVTSFEITDR